MNDDEFRDSLSEAGKVLFDATNWGEPLAPPTWVGAYYMACLSCGRTMRRGTQCPNCGAWCR